jgi:hypothetical protein
VFTDAFIVFCLRKNILMVAISQYEDAALDTTQKFLNDHL